MKVLNSYKIFENLQYAKKTLTDLKIEETNPDFLKLKELLKNNMGYIGKFTDWLFKDHESFDQLEEIYNILKTNNLDKPITDFKKAEDLFDYMQSKNINTKVNQVLKALPSKARKYVNQELINLISLNIEHADVLIKLYSTKGGRYSKLGEKELYDDTKALIENIKGDFNSDSVKKQIENLNIEIVHDTPTALVIIVKDYKSSRKIGSKYWCLSTSENMWNNYVDGTTQQYFIWDFTKNISNKEHMVGATIELGGRIKYAHWSDDTKVEDPSRIFEEIE